MKSSIVFAASIFLLMLGCDQAETALPTGVDGRPLPSLAPMLENVTPAVVNIATRGRVVVNNPLLNDPFFNQFFNAPRQQRERNTKGLGSGVIVDSKRGIILTNNHVVDKMTDISVTLDDGRQFEAEVVGTDPETDVAVIKIEADNLTQLSIADSESLRVGDFVVAIGNPFGLGQTVTSGIISALGRSGLGIESYENFIQTDASINPGNSGGALVNLRGELIGINTAILGPAGGNIGIGFAIPINMGRHIMDQLVNNGEVQRGRLGVLAQDLTPELAQAFQLRETRGAVISSVEPGSSAERAGLKAGDVVVEINNRTIISSADLRNTIGLMAVGSSLNLVVIREGKPLRIDAKLGGTTAKEGQQSLLESAPRYGREESHFVAVLN